MQIIRIYGHSPFKRTHRVRVLDNLQIICSTSKFVMQDRQLTNILWVSTTDWALYICVPLCVVIECSEVLALEGVLLEALPLGVPCISVL